MNKSNTTAIISLNPLIVPSSYTYLSWDLTIRLVMLGIGVTTNLINISVFLNHRLKDTSYKYMLVNSITNFLYLTITFAGVFAYNCTYCPSSQSYPAVIYSIALIFYVSSCLAIFRILVEIAISVRTYLILTNKSFNRLSYKQILFVLFLIAFVYYGQQPFIYEISVARNPQGGAVYASRLNDFGNSSFATKLVISQFSMRIFLAVFILSTVNFFNVIEFQKRLNAQLNLKQSQYVYDYHWSFRDSQKVSNAPQRASKASRTSQSQSSTSSRRKTSRNLTRMVIYSSFMSAIGTTPYAIIYILKSTIFTSAQIYIYNSMSLVLLVTPPAFEILVYYRFNRHFRLVLDIYTRAVCL